MKALFSGVLATLLLLTTNARADERSLPGRDDYMRYCSACHGEAADGNGPVANVLTPRPPALTSLREKYGNPLSTKLTTYISGTTMPRAHGLSDMPVWGRVLREEKGSDDAAAQILWRIVRYLDSIQLQD